MSVAKGGVGLGAEIVVEILTQRSQVSMAEIGTGRIQHPSIRLSIWSGGASQPPMHFSDCFICCLPSSGAMAALHRQSVRF